MAQTEALVLARLPRDLSTIVLDYFRAPLREPDAIAEAGEWEEVIGLGYSYETLEGACLGQHVELITHLLTLGTEEEHFYDDIDSCFGESVSANKLESVCAMLDAEVQSANDLLRDACLYGNLDAAHLAIGRGADCWEDALDSACYGCHHDLVALMMIHGTGPCRCGVDHLAEVSAN